MEESWLLTFCSPPSSGRIFFAATLNRMNNLCARAPFADHFRNKAGWMLKVGIQGDYHFASGMVQSGCEGNLVAEVPGKEYPLEATIGGAQLPDPAATSVRAPVVAEHELERARIIAAQDRVEVPDVRLEVADFLPPRPQS